MATYSKFNSFVEAVHKGIHALGTHQLKVALTNTAPSAGNTVLANITEISYTNCSSRNVTTNSASQTGGVFKLVLADLTLTASGGQVGPFRYVVIYNDGAASDELIGWYDRGVETTLEDGDQLALDFDGTDGLFEAA